MLKSRKFRITVVDSQSPSGNKEITNPDKTVKYNGKMQTVKF